MNLIKSYLHERDKRLVEWMRERIRGKMEIYYNESRENLNRNNVMIAYDMDSRYVAMKHFLSILDEE